MLLLSEVIYKYQSGSSWLIALVKSSKSTLVFCLPVQLIIERVVLKSLTIIVDFFVYFFLQFYQFWFMYFEDLLFRLA